MPVLYRPGLKLGILGGGQLGRMLIQAAIDLDLEVHVLDPDPAAPARAMAHHFTCGSFADEATVLGFARPLDLLTIEIEAVNTAALHRLAGQGLPVFPEPHVIEIIQDKATQKAFYQQQGLPTAQAIAVGGIAELTEKAFYPCVQKLNRGGYDGRGVQILRNPTDLHLALPGPSILEEAIAIEKEISVLVARNQNGKLAVYDPVELTYHDALLVDSLIAPARISAELADQARILALRTADALGITGIIAVEMFLTQRTGRPELLINECAPRPHNSGHHTMRACQMSQFEAHLRAISGLPFGSTGLWSAAAMVNITGKAEGPGFQKNIPELLAIPGTSVHLYGKEHKVGRKLGHVITMAGAETLEEQIRRIQSLI